ncbi:MAG: hypothetical protein ABH862_01005 [Candidatus Omnitrophota bacterium]
MAEKKGSPVTSHQVTRRLTEVNSLCHPERAERVEGSWVKRKTGQMKKGKNNKQIEKISLLRELVDKNISKDLISKLGKFVIYSNEVEFFTIQAARLLEQIILKGQLGRRGKTTFIPHNDDWFYEERKVKTRAILKELKKVYLLKIEKMIIQIL